MGAALRTDQRTFSAPLRWLAIAGAAALGAASGNLINVEPLGWTYDSLLEIIAGPGVQIASLTSGLAMGFVLGFIHFTSI
jgi:hypothetical protein